MRRARGKRGASASRRRRGSAARVHQRLFKRACPGTRLGVLCSTNRCTPLFLEADYLQSTKIDSGPGRAGRVHNARSGRGALADATIKLGPHSGSYTLLPGSLGGSQATKLRFRVICPSHRSEAERSCAVLLDGTKIGDAGNDDDANDEEAQMYKWRASLLQWCKVELGSEALEAYTDTVKLVSFMELRPYSYSSATAIPDTESPAH